ncbi:DegT/DnrJ/EryC1/StrS family aminotransferase [Paraburkholderia rhizosphaerae]|uniref:dTDP-4-amino-4,6-dideoxygalactose transaminase n=1 Tax=Paraburkholderia rhizosphaerae TaxID=480658 RepID=A0A4R8LJ24_9BURK|nr:DegT/DnrJ/EryC1/StrS family aminotransferase [Paraburkholderia rhizosphaerae]TDY42908.1 dTDP-4-amino-4,6-dideoxygalactose transaminase [Paraburkholderia rhizosphaerae]
MDNQKASFVPVTQPYLPPLAEFTPYLEQIWSNKWVTNDGPFHHQLEAALCERLGVEHICLFSNGTIALITALQALDISGEVITTPFSFVATTHALHWNRIKPVFVDIDPVSMNLDPAKIEAAITPRTSAILPVHVYGNPCEVEAIERIAAKHGLRVLYDAAHAFGVQRDGQSILRAGDMSILSFHGTKIFHTFEGGAIVCRDAEMKRRIDRLKNFGIVDEVTVAATGLNGKMNEVQAAFGMLQLKHVDYALAQRARIDSRYREALGGLRGLKLHQIDSNNTRNHAYFPIRITPEFPISRDALFEQFRERHIAVRRYFYPLISEFVPYRDLPSASRENLPVASEVSSEVLCLPMYTMLEAAEQERIIEIILSCATHAQAA